jgi:hypothetical protein
VGARRGGRASRSGISTPALPPRDRPMASRASPPLNAFSTPASARAHGHDEPKPILPAAALGSAAGAAIDSVASRRTIARWARGAPKARDLRQMRHPTRTDERRPGFRYESSAESRLPRPPRVIARWARRASPTPNALAALGGTRVWNAPDRSRDRRPRLSRSQSTVCRLIRPRESACPKVFSDCRIPGARRSQP